MDTSARVRKLKFGKMPRVAIAVVMLFAAVPRTHSAPQQPAPIKITTTKLGDATAGRAYSKLIEVEGGKLPFVFTATGLPGWPRHSEFQ